MTTFAPFSSGKTAQNLRAIMEKNSLTNRDVSELACVCVKTVESWLADPAAKSHRAMPPRHLIAIAHQLPGFLKRRKAAKKAAK